VACTRHTAAIHHRPGRDTKLGVIRMTKGETRACICDRGSNVSGAECRKEHGHRRHGSREPGSPMPVVPDADHVDA
jgi:hypothetical protein